MEFLQTRQQRGQQSATRQADTTASDWVVRRNMFKKARKKLDWMNSYVALGDFIGN